MPANMSDTHQRKNLLRIFRAMDELIEPILVKANNTGGPWTSIRLIASKSASISRSIALAVQTQSGA